MKPRFFIQRNKNQKWVVYERISFAPYFKAVSQEVDSKDEANEIRLQLLTANFSQHGLEYLI